ncbi:MAG: HNH endonuclease signature motif containing protein [Lacisediminihabitans sp.]
MTSRNGRPVYVHRLAWQDANGPIPDGMLVCHRCDNPACYHLPHLFLGTYADNNRDMVAKGRHWSQIKTHCARGHLLSADNLVPALLAKGKRRCLTCRRSEGRKAQLKYTARKETV